MRARLARGGVLLALAASTLTLAPAPATTVFDGTCLVNVLLKFSPRLNMGSLTTGVTVDGSGTCATDADTGALPGSLVKTITIGGSASGIVACESMTGAGFYNVSFSPAPAPPGNDGSLILEGNVAAVTLVLLDAPTFEGEASLFLDPLSSTVNNVPSCLASGTAGAASLAYEGVLTFTDPS